jgi:hypothetical protein
VQTLIAVSGVFAGLLAGLGTPWLTSLMSKRSGQASEQHAVADRLLSLWEHPEPIPEILRADLYGARRSLILLGSRLSDSAAREACLSMVRIAADQNATDEALVDAWSDFVAAVAPVFRRSAGAARA